ncbi:Hsp20/alpha crystallin family protein [Tepidibacillus sp. LV47]|uniref:Hsp20/alpha crystallin family protein n=1 Tax=Tepidibacillus sp. LV47 TaxID=3398228 RepID=UPI003AAD017A
MPFNPFDFVNMDASLFENEWEKYRSFFEKFFNLNEKNLTQTRTIPIDLYQRQHDLLLVLEIPGLKDEKDIQLKVVGQTLIVEGEINRSYIPQEGEIVKSERKIGKFSRKMTIPVAFDSKKIHARYQNGLLEVRIPIIKSNQQDKIMVRFTER